MYANIVAMISESCCKNLSLHIRGEIDGLIINGRCISMDAVSPARMPTCMAVGEAAGVCAALAAGRDLTPSVIDAAEVIESLKNGAILSV